MAPASSMPSSDAMKEKEVGITEYVSSAGKGFQGLLKKRYTDFLVNEIQPDGTVVHLRTTRPQKHTGHRKPEKSGDPPVEVKAETTVQTTADTKVENTAETTAEVTTEAKAEAEKPESVITTNDNQSSDPPAVPVEDISKLLVCLSEKTTEAILALYNKILANPNARPRDHGHVEGPIPEDRQVRTTIHNDIRRIFHSRIESSTEKERNLIVFSAAQPVRGNAPPGRVNYGSSRGNNGNSERQGKLGWADRGGEFLHFSLYKENKDTMECISFITKQLRSNPKSFQFAGTKDRRAVTVQRVSAYRVEDFRLAGLNRMLRNSSVGDFTYHPHGLQLGDLTGNEFYITLRDCEWEDHEGAAAGKLMSAETALTNACLGLQQQGFLNYFGLQRFGTFATGTHTVGIKLLKGDFQGACDAILDFPASLLTAELENPRDRISADDKARAHAIDSFRTTGKSQEALANLPRKFSGENNIIRHLSRNPTDFAGAIQMIPRNLKLMYVHAYQALVWNHVASERWRKHGSTVVEGDLVLINEVIDTSSPPAAAQTDADGEVIIQPSGTERAQAYDDKFQRARRLSATEAASGEYTIFDIVLPLPGFDVEYPSGHIEEFYKTFMGSDNGGGMDPYDMRRKQRDFSLSGSYRKIVARIAEDWEAGIRTYVQEDQQFVETDVELMNKRRVDPARDDSGVLTGKAGLDGNGDAKVEGDGDGDVAMDEKLAVVLKIQLGSSQYATMALRELSKSGVKAYKPDFGGR